MHIIITGGSGLIGRELTANLTNKGYEVIILSRSPQAVSGLPQGARAEEWDARSAAGWGHLADGATAIINLAGENIAAGRWTEPRKRRILESRINAGRAVTAAVQAATQKPKVVVQASAVGFYGPSNGRDLTEAASAGDDFLARVCVAWEDSTQAVEAWGVRRVVTRIGVVLSREGGALPKMALPFKLFAGGPIGSGRQYLPWIHLEDVVGAITFLIETENASGAFNLTAPQPLSNAQFGQVLGNVLHRPALLPTPAFALRLVFGEMATVLLDGQKAVPDRLQQAGYHFQFAQAQAALQDLF